MKLASWSARAGGDARKHMTVAGTDDAGVQVAFTDVVEIKNDTRAGRTIAEREDGEAVVLA